MGLASLWVVLAILCPWPHRSAHYSLVRPRPVPPGHAGAGTVRSGVVVPLAAAIRAIRAIRTIAPYQPHVPAPPLKGPLTSEVIQPP